MVNGGKGSIKWRLLSVPLCLPLFLFWLFLAYVTTKFIGTRTNKIVKGKYIKIIETVNLGFDSRLHLVKAGEEFVLISTCGKCPDVGQGEIGRLLFR